MNRALALTLSEQQEAWITPDTIINYRKNLKIDVLRNESFVTYALNNTPKTLCSKPMKWVRKQQQKHYSPVVCNLFSFHHLRTF